MTRPAWAGTTDLIEEFHVITVERRITTPAWRPSPRPPDGGCSPTGGVEPPALRIAIPHWRRRGRRYFGLACRSASRRSVISAAGIGAGRNEVALHDGSRAPAGVCDWAALSTPSATTPTPRCAWRPPGSPAPPPVTVCVRRGRRRKAQSILSQSTGGSRRLASEGVANTEDHRWQNARRVHDRPASVPARASGSSSAAVSVISSISRSRGRSP